MGIKTRNTAFVEVYRYSEKKSKSKAIYTIQENIQIFFLRCALADVSEFHRK